MNGKPREEDIHGRVLTWAASCSGKLMSVVFCWGGNWKPFPFTNKNQINWKWNPLWNQRKREVKTNSEEKNTGKGRREIQIFATI